MKYLAKSVLISILAIGMSSCSDHDNMKSDHSHDEMTDHKPQNHEDAKGHETNMDERKPVYLSAGERQHVLAEMRGLLQSTQGVIEGLATDDMDMVQKSALAAGTGGRKTTENNIMHKKMPKEWMMLGKAAHKSMDEIAGMAADGKPAKEIQLKLVRAMDHCMACHTAFRLPNP